MKGMSVSSSRAVNLLDRAIVGSTIVDGERRDRMVAGLRLDRRLRITEQTDVGHPAIRLR